MKGEGMEDKGKQIYSKEAAIKDLKKIFSKNFNEYKNWACKCYKIALEIIKTTPVFPCGFPCGSYYQTRIHTLIGKKSDCSLRFWLKTTEGYKSTIRLYIEGENYLSGPFGRHITNAVVFKPDGLVALFKQNRLIIVDRKERQMLEKILNLLKEKKVNQEVVESLQWFYNLQFFWLNFAHISYNSFNGEFNY